nr:granzyme-like protein 2 [Peromyscus maniculatus bairdii]
MVLSRCKKSEVEIVKEWDQMHLNDNQLLQENITVTLGAHDIRKQENRQRISVVKSVPHQDFNRKTLVNDIMLLKLKHKARLNNVVQKIDLPKSQDWVKPGQVCTVAGGDSGGPFVCHNVAQGIVNRNFNTIKPPRAFTRICSFLRWIQEKMKLLQQP